MQSLTRLLTLTAMPLALVLPTLASAHPGHAVTTGPAAGLLAGLTHPLLGIDHLAATLVVGAWAAQRGGRLRFVLPASFALALLLGVFAAPALQVHAGPVEQLIAASLLVLGALVAFAGNIPAAACVALAAGFAFFHGLAHGTEQPPATALASYGAGLAITTLALGSLAMLLGTLLRQHRGERPLRWFGAACACGGLVLLV